MSGETPAFLDQVICSAVSCLAVQLFSHLTVCLSGGLFISLVTLVQLLQNGLLLEARSETLFETTLFTKVPRDLPFLGGHSRCSRESLSNMIKPARDWYTSGNLIFRYTLV